MRRLGKALAILGLLLGLGTSAALLLPWHLAGLSWLIGVGLAKLSYLSAVGLIGAGAVVQRIAASDPLSKRRLPSPPPSG